MHNHQDPWALLFSWLTSLASVTYFGMNLPTLCLSVATLWWTIERARSERARRRAYEDQLEHSRPMRRSFLTWLSDQSKPTPLDEESGHDNGRNR